MTQVIFSSSAKQPQLQGAPQNHMPACGVGADGFRILKGLGFRVSGFYNIAERWRVQGLARLRSMDDRGGEDADPRSPLSERRGSESGRLLSEDSKRAAASQVQALTLQYSVIIIFYSDVMLLPSRHNLPTRPYR